MKLIASVSAAAVTLAVTATASQADGFGDTLEIVPHVFNVHHTKCVLVCEDDDDDRRRSYRRDRDDDD